MNRVSDITISDVGRGIGRYLPYICTVVACLLIVTVLPAERRDGSGSPDQVPLAARAADTMGAANLTSDQAEPDGPTGGVGGPAGSTRPVAPTRGVTVSTRKWPGVGSPEALSAPDCDRKTGRLMMPTAYAPPCVPLWPKGAANGGATSRGVTDKEIVVVLRSPPSDAQSDAFNAALDYASDAQVEKDLLQSIIDLWQAHAETYGRKIRLHHFVGSGTSAEAGRADAIEISQELKPFMVFAPGGNHAVFGRELSARGTFSFHWQVFAQNDYEKMSPYLFTSDAASTEQDVTALAEYVGKRLWGRNAKWARDPLLQQAPRKFGVSYPDNETGRAAIALFQRELAKYGAKATVVVGTTGAAEQSQVVMTKFKDAGVSVVIPLLVGTGPVFLQAEATKQNYFPEWLVQGFFFRVTGRAFQDPAQADQTYGITSNLIPLRLEHWDNTRLYRWEYGPDANPNPEGSQQAWRHFFVQAAILFGGIQLAGPNLTHQGFRDAVFANPVSGGATTGAVTSKALSFGRQGFWPSVDYAGSDDYAEAWWSNTAKEENGATDGSGKATQEQAGSWMWLNKGKRWLPGQWPRTEPDMFNAQAATISLTKPPDGEVKSYPNMKIRGK